MLGINMNHRGSSGLTTPFPGKDTASFTVGCRGFALQSYPLEYPLDGTKETMSQIQLLDKMFLSA